ncbi:MAG: sulfatase-like hydrolase/transferase [Rhodospirillales bacterium]|nr:sulfatase-like hydrolase/transferase [Rhodospirillales bacterium]MDP6645426.1 sulfatase-like hydrolase/transferase [Rhodospirillales bacterium]MDP6841684.1 sulfatase-like hydrolase/transferase [Rhodospirillales bacterium]|tara:strand:- start:1206 stop:2690 length:1485 start_codon:yes stop_codon:yes gene_type:complete
MAKQKRPNVVLIMTDNQPADLLGCYGNDEMRSPRLDQMAADGIRFDNAYCPNAMCSPSRASVWTGRMPCQHGVHTWLDDRLMGRWPAGWNAVAEFDTLPEILKRNGYATAMIGKYHLGAFNEAQNGIDHWITMARGHTLDFHGNEMTVNGDSFVYNGHSVDFFTEQAVDYIGGRAGKDQPFLLLLPYNGPYGHWPSIKGRAGHRFGDLYDLTPMHSVPREGIAKEAIELYEMNKEFMPKDKGGPDFSALLQIPNDLTSLRNYYSQMSLIDDGVGQVLDALERGGLDGDTIVVFTADHGFSLGHHGFWGHGQATWPSNMFRVAYNIPLLVRAPGAIQPGQGSQHLVSSMDLFATILDYLGLTSETDMAGVPARSFAPELTGDALDWDDVVFLEQEESRAMRTPEWLYVKRFKGSNAYPLEDELYDFENDPDERRNLAGDGDYAKVRQDLDARLDAFFARYADPRFDLWRGGAAKSNSSRPWLWRDAWGADWETVT